MGNKTSVQWNYVLYLATFVLVRGEKDFMLRPPESEETYSWKKLRKEKDFRLIFSLLKSEF